MPTRMKQNQSHVHLLLTKELHQKLKSTYWNVSRAVEEVMRKELGMPHENRKKAKQHG